MGVLRQRVETIRAVISEHHEIEHLAFVTIVCNRCGRTQIIDGDIDFAERVTADWRFGEYGADEDYCPRCK